ncbi:MAG: DUF3568 family protein [Verrucomicrobiae bacterium]|nr:DUF3568 family protein [Verrucomicrobiae bacterium]
MKTITNLLAAGLLTCFGAFSFSGCAVLLIGAAVGTAVYLEGELESHLSTDIHGAIDATNVAAQQLGLRPVSRTGDASEALMIATDSEERKIRIKLTPDEMNNRITKVKIRVGVGGDEDASRRILAAIERNVGR